MSNSYSIGCVKCKKYLWIAQGWLPEEFIFYSGEPDTMQKLSRFLKEHINHPLLFFDSSNGDETFPDFYHDDELTEKRIWQEID